MGNNRAEVIVNRSGAESVFTSSVALYREANNIGSVSTTFKMGSLLVISAESLFLIFTTFPVAQSMSESTQKVFPCQRPILTAFQTVSTSWNYCNHFFVRSALIRLNRKPQSQDSISCYLFCTLHLFEECRS